MAFSGRIYYEDKEQPKYINSPESLIFLIKSEVLYNLDKAQLAITKANRVILHEGFMDVFLPQLRQDLMKRFAQWEQH
ncbi:MAG: hypothetical protein L6U99_10550 [Clostridium sp.]|nr:MAG: hypothetical protein L6U99_10550 [Clostridium sp.]